VTPISPRERLDLGAPQLGTRVGGHALETMVMLASRVPADPRFRRTLIQR
jgi:hypothetical protein